jgi:hypothetical protein
MSSSLSVELEGSVGFGWIDPIAAIAMMAMIGERLITYLLRQGRNLRTHDYIQTVAFQSFSHYWPVSRSGLTFDIRCCVIVAASRPRPVMHHANVPRTTPVVAKGTTLRPQVAVWERKVPVGPGITGLWRPVPRTGEGSDLLALLFGAGNMVFSLTQDGNKLTGSVEGAGAGFFGGNDVPIPIVEGKVDGVSVSFKAGNTTYSGTLNGDQIEFGRRIDFGFRLPPAPKAPAGTRPAIGPPPDETGPSVGAGWRRPRIRLFCIACSGKVRLMFLAVR